MKDTSVKSKILYVFYFVRAFFINAFIEYRLNRQLNKRRNWNAYRIGGGGVVPLGKVKQETAISKATKLGSVSYVDSDNAVIFYSTYQQ